MKFFFKSMSVIYKYKKIQQFKSYKPSEISGERVKNHHLNVSNVDSREEYIFATFGMTLLLLKLEKLQ